MAKSNNQNKTKISSELIQLLLSIVVIGVFSLVEIWLIFYYGEGFVFPLIFGVLIILMTCLVALNVYQIFIRRLAASGGGSDKKAEYLIYKQVKSLPDEFDVKLKNEMTALNEDIAKTQMKTAKAILMKVDEKLAQVPTASSEDNSKVEQMQAQILELTNQVNILKTQNDELLNKINSALIDNEEIKDSFPELQNEHKKVFDLLGSIAFRNDEIKALLEDVEHAQEEFSESIVHHSEVADARMGQMPADSMTDIAEEIQPQIEDLTDEGGLSGIQMEGLTEDDLSGVQMEGLTEDDLSGIQTEDLMTEENLTEPQMEAVEEAVEEVVTEPQIGDFAGLGDDPNKQLSPDEIAAMFANI